MYLLYQTALSTRRDSVSAVGAMERHRRPRPKAAASAAKNVRSAEQTAQSYADARPDVTIVPAINPTGTSGNDNGK